MGRMIQTIDDYDVGQLLGRGGFASVYRARERSTCLLFAVKIMIKSYIEKHKMQSRVFNEIQIHSELNCEGIVKLHSHFEDSEFVYLVLELCEGGNLYQYLKSNGPLSEIEASSVISQLLTSLEYMHGQGVVHRDLKLSNILLVQDSNQPSSSTHSLLERGIKLCDFGLAIQVGHPDEEHFTLCGTPNYIAPEIASQRAHGFPADLWSVGCLFYSMLTGAPPFEQSGLKKTLQSIIAGQFTLPKGLSAGASDFIKCLIHLNPQQRLNVGEILDHPFLKSAPSLSNSMTLKTKSLKVDNNISDPNVMKGVKASQVTGNRNIRESSEYHSKDSSTVYLNDSRSHIGSRSSANGRSKVSRIPRAIRSNGHVCVTDPTLSSSEESSPTSSFSSPSKSVATSSSTLVSEYHASPVSFYSKIAPAGTGRNRDGTNPGDDRHTEESSGVSMSTINQPSVMMGTAVKSIGGNRDGTRYETGHVPPKGSNVCNREALRRPIMSAEPEMTPSPSSSNSFRSRGSPVTVPHDSSPTYLSKASLPMRKSSTHVHDPTRTAPLRTSSSCSESTHSSWLQAIRSVRESVSDLLPHDTGSVSGGKVGNEWKSGRHVDVGCSTMSFNASARMEVQKEQYGFIRMGCLTNVSREGDNRLQYLPHAASSTGSGYVAHHHGSDKPIPLRPDRATSNLQCDRNSLSTSVSISIGNCSFNGANWFGELGSSSSRCAPLDQFMFISPQKEVLLLNEQGTAICCGVIKDKSGRMIPCRLISSSLTPNIVTLGKLDEHMLRELQGLQTGPMSETDSESDSDSDIEDDEFIRKHNSALSDIDSADEIVAAAQCNIPVPEVTPQYSEFDSFYNCDSDEEVKKKEIALPSRAPPDSMKKPPMRKKDPRPDTRLSAAKGLRLFSEELLLRSYHLDATPSLRSSLLTGSIILSSSLRTSSDSRPSNIQPLPTVLIALYNRAAEVFENIRRKLPKIIMYVPAAVQSPLTDPVRGVALKCSLMSNGPLPDMFCKWTNGTKLWYSLQTGKTSIECSSEVLPSGLFKPLPLQGSESESRMSIEVGKRRKDCGYCWRGDLVSAASTSSLRSSLCNFNSDPRSRDLGLDLDSNPIPDALKIYLELAQKCLKLCLEEDAKLNINTKFQGRSRASQSMRATRNEYGGHSNSLKCKCRDARRDGKCCHPILPIVFIGHL